MRGRTAQTCAVTVEPQTDGWLQDNMFQLGWMAAGQTASWQDGCVGPTHRAVPLSEQGHAVAICQRTVLSHPAAPPVPQARISQAFINHSSTASASPRLCGEPRQEANKRLCVLAAAAAVPRGAVPLSTCRQQARWDGACPHLWAHVGTHGRVLLSSDFSSEPCLAVWDRQRQWLGCR